MSESEQNPQNPAPTPAPAATQATEAPSSPIKKSSGGTDLRQYTIVESTHQRNTYVKRHYSSHF